VDADDEPEEEPKPILTAAEPVTREPAAKKKAPQNAPDPKRAAGRLLRKSVQLLQDKEDGDWVLSTSVKNQMLRIDPTFSEKALGFKTFTDFVKEYNSVVERDDSTSIRKLRLREKKNDA